MVRNTRLIMALAACGVLAAGVASANVPVPALSNVPRAMFIGPNAAFQATHSADRSKYNVTIVGTGGPINAAQVQVRMNVPGDTLTCWCNGLAGPRPYVFSGTTNASGIARLIISGGGCIQYGLAAIPGTSDFAGEVFADGVRMQEVGTVSPDAVDNSGRRPTELPPVWDPAGSCAPGLADAVEHTTPLATSAYDWCSDVGGGPGPAPDGAVGLNDGISIGDWLSGAYSCAGNAGP